MAKGLHSMSLPGIKPLGGGKTMSKLNRRFNCVVASRLDQPQTVYRWFRRHGFPKLMKKIGRLSQTVLKLGNKYVKLPNTFIAD